MIPLPTQFAGSTRLLAQAPSECSLVGVDPGGDQGGKLRKYLVT